MPCRDLSSSPVTLSIIFKPWPARQGIPGGSEYLRGRPHQKQKKARCFMLAAGMWARTAQNFLVKGVSMQVTNRTPGKFRVDSLVTEIRAPCTPCFLHLRCRGCKDSRRSTAVSPRCTGRSSALRTRDQNAQALADRWLEASGETRAQVLSSSKNFRVKYQSQHRQGSR